MLDKIGLSLLYFFGTIIFGIAGAIFGTGLGFMVRGQFDGVAIKYFSIGLLILIVFYTLHKKIGKKISEQLLPYIKNSMTFGSLVFAATFVILIIKVQGNGI